MTTSPSRSGWSSSWRIGAHLRRASADEGPVTSGALGDDALQQRFGLTDRQVEVARLLAQGLSNAEIAEGPGLSTYTARNHTEAVLLGLGASTRARVGAILRGQQDAPSRHVVRRACVSCARALRESAARDGVSAYVLMDAGDRSPAPPPPSLRLLAAGDDGRDALGRAATAPQPREPRHGDRRGADRVCDLSPRARSASASSR
ncbi:MAG: helix-turn-helix transcriptional regulator [Gemmatimonadetes bacterium]|nr:helix-turn-helix transcriptional regulator [Gemmatimonadota bacterium]